MAWVYLDDQFPEHPKIAMAGGDAGWMFVCGLAYTRRAEMKGKIPKAQVPRLTDRKKPDHLAATLVRVGLWENLDADFFLVHDYDEWNRPEESRKAAARKAAKARWDKERDAHAHADALPSHPERIAEADADRCPPPLPSPSVSSSSSSEPLSRPSGSEEDPISGEVWRLLAKFDADAFVAKGGVIRSKAWFTTAAETRRMAHKPVLEELTAEHPDWSAQQLAQAILDGSASGVLSQDDRAVAAMRARMDLNERRKRGEVCPDCHGRGVIELENGDVDDCQCKFRRTA